MKAHFTKLVKAGNKLREFNFRRLSPPSENLFHVDISDERGNRIIFKMRKTDEMWRIIDTSLPQWIYDAEPKLSEAIED